MTRTEKKCILCIIVCMVCDEWSVYNRVVRKRKNALHAFILAIYVYMYFVFYPMTASM